MGRRYPQRPVVGVGGIVLALDQVLLVQRGAPPSKGLWSLPGGAVRVGESLREACAREVAEETGVAVSVGPLVEVFERILRDPDGRVEYHYVLHDYLCTAPLTPPQAGDDAADARWAPLAELDRAQLTPDTQRVILAAAAMRRGTG
ncbi:MAG: NUDIX hydrolase [Thermodesulfobacteriota bacterium]